MTTLRTRRDAPDAVGAVRDGPLFARVPPPMLTGRALASGRSTDPSPADDDEGDGDGRTGSGTDSTVGVTRTGAFSLVPRRAYVENRRNSFSRVDEATLGQIRQPLRITVFLSPEDPAGVLLLAAALMRVAARYGYQYDVLAEPLVVGYAERFLAEHRTVLREGPECNQAIVEILDVFVRVGWPSAHRLVYRLDDIYR